MTDDLWASLIIASAWILLAVGVVYGWDVAKALWMLWVMKRRDTANEAKLDAALQRSITASWTRFAIDEAMWTAYYAWNAWQPESVEEDIDDRSI